MNLAKYVSILIVSFNIHAMEIGDLQEKVSHWQELPQELQREVLEYQVLEAVNNHIKNCKKITHIIMLQECIKMIQKDAESVDFKLLSRVALVDKNFLNISKGLVSQVLQEQQTQAFIKQQIPSLILNFAKGKGLEVATGVDWFGNKNYRLIYSLPAPQALRNLLGDDALQNSSANTSGYLQDFDSTDSDIAQQQYRFINTFLLKSYISDKDPKTLEALKCAFDNKLFIGQNDFAEINQIAVFLNDTEVLGLLDGHAQNIAKEPRD